MSSLANLTVLHADAAIPDAAFLRGYGIDVPLESARLNLAIGSRYLAYGDSQTRRNPYQGMTLVMAAMACEVLSDDGVLPSILPARYPTGLSQGSTALKRAGVTALDIVRAWELRPAILMACFPLDIMVEFVDPVAWPYLEAFIAAGPAEATKRLYEAIKGESQRLTARTVRTQVSSAWLLMRLLNEFHAQYRAENDGRVRRGLAELALPSDLAAWTWQPPKVLERTLVKMGARTDRRETSALPLDAVRTALRRRAAEARLHQYLPEQWPFNVRWRSLKRVTTLSLLAGLSPRVAHLRMLDVDDFAWHRFEDGSEAWGLRMRGEIMKLRSANEVYWVKLPDSLAQIIHAWIVCSGREIGQSGAPLLIANKLTEAGESGKRYAETALSGFITGSLRGDGGSQAIISDGPIPQSGYQAHRYRSFVVQNVDAVIHVWRLQNPTHPLASVEPTTFAELLVDHRDDDMGYRDHSFTLRREQIVALAAELHWNSIWGDGALRRGLNADAIRAARERCQLITAQIDALDHEIAELEAEKNRFREEHSELLRRSRSLVGDEREDARFELDAWRDQIDDLDDQISQEFRRQLRAKDALLQARAELEAATTTEVALPDELSPEAYEQLLAEALGNDAYQPVELAAAMADELTSGDVADLFGVHAQTIWRWRTGKGGMPHPRPFDPSNWIKYSEKDFRLPATAINLLAIPAADPQHAVDTIRRRRAVLGHGHRHRNPSPYALAA